MQTDVNGCEWVCMRAMGPRVHGRTEKQGKQRQNGYLGHDLGSMAGEISPDMMFCDFKQKMVRVGAGGCKWVRMEANGCKGTGRQENSAKEVQTGSSGDVFQLMSTGKKNIQTLGVVMVD